MRVAEEVKAFFHQEGIHSTTIQPEFVEVRVYVDYVIPFILFLLCFSMCFVVDTYVFKSVDYLLYV